MQLATCIHKLQKLCKKERKKKSYFVMVVSHPMMQNIMPSDKDAFWCDLVWSWLMIQSLSYILVSNIHIIANALGLYRTSRPVQKSGKLSKSGLSGNRTFFFLPGRRTFKNKIEIQKKKSKSKKFFQILFFCLFTFF